MINSRTPSTLAPIHTQATNSLLVITANTSAARPITASTSEIISTGYPPADGATLPPVHDPDLCGRQPTGLVVTPIELVEPRSVVGGAGIDRRSRPTLSELLELRLEVGLEPGAVLAFEGAQLLEPSLENRPLLVDRAHDLGVFALGVGLQCTGLLLGLTQLGLGTGLRIGEQGIGTLTRLGDRGLGFATSVADDLLGVGPGVGQQLVRLGLGGAGQPVSGVLGQGEHPRRLEGLLLAELRGGGGGGGSCRDGLRWTC